MIIEQFLILQWLIYIARHILGSLSGYEYSPHKWVQ